MEIGDLRTNRSKFDVGILVAVMATILSRLPFLANGHGIDQDAWQVANVARDFAQTGHYQVSRFPGYPFQELSYSLVWNSGPFVFNLITTLLGALGVFYFVKILRFYKSKASVLGGIALAFIPCIYIYSTYSIDYIWGMAFIIASMYYCLQNKPIIAGLFLGLAIGTRITSGAMLLPLSLVFYAHDKQHAFRNILVYGTTALFIGAACFIPVFSAYGLSFIRFYDSAYPGLSSIVGRGVIRVWGVVGTIALGAVLLSIFALPRKNTFISRESTPAALIVAWASVLVLYGIAFLRLPHEPGYLVPILPFVILLLQRFVHKKAFIGFAILIMASPFVFNLERSGVSIQGPILVDYEARVERSAFVVRVLTWEREQSSSNNIIVSGFYVAEIENILGSRIGMHAEFVYLLDRTQLSNYQSQGMIIYYLPGIREYESDTYGIDLAASGGQILNP